MSSNHFGNLLTEARDVDVSQRALRLNPENPDNEPTENARIKHALLAGQFLGAMFALDIAPLPVYRTHRHEYEVYERNWCWPLLRYTNCYRPAIEMIGHGFIICDRWEDHDPEREYSGLGLVLMTDGLVHRFVDHPLTDGREGYPEPHIYALGMRPSNPVLDTKRFLAEEGRDEMLAAAIVAHEQGRYKEPNKTSLDSVRRRSAL